MVPAQVALSLSRVLSHLQVVGDGDYGKKNQEEHCQRCNLRPPARAVAACMA